MPLNQQSQAQPKARTARVKQLLDIATPTTEWEHKLLEGHVHRLLNLATAEMNITRVHALLDAGARVVASENEADGEGGWTLLHHIIQGDGLCSDGSNVDLLEGLLKRPEVAKAINHCNDDGETALYLAVQQPGLDHACVALIEHGARTDASRKPTFGDRANEDKMQEWQYLIDRPFDKPNTVCAYLKIKSTDAAQAAFLINSLQTAGIIKQQATLSHLETTIGWVALALGGFANDNESSQERKHAMRTQLENLALRLLRWGAEADKSLPRDVWLAERAPLLDRLVDTFQQAGCQMWTPQTPEHPQPKTTSFLAAIGMADLGAELERIHLDRLAPSTSSSLHRPRL